jgi:ectoine hydroxylase-related dioxygenase (phytanoyl-CoA dioxygenase family)
MASAMVEADGSLHENVDVQQLQELDDPAVAAWLARAERSGPPDLGYRYVFEADELAAIRHCHDEHGFAIVKDVIDQATVDALKADLVAVLDPHRTIQPGQTRVGHAFIEHSPATEALLSHEKLLRIHRALLGVDQLHLHRTAGYLKAPGSGPLNWHMDYGGFVALPPSSSGAFMNRSEVDPNGFYFYLNGSHPAKGGLAVLENSHRKDWAGPTGLASGGGSWEKKHSSFNGRHRTMEMAECVPLFSNPQDLIIFAARTYHAAFPMAADAMDEPRLSLGLRFRSHAGLGDGDPALAKLAESWRSAGVAEGAAAPWPLPDAAKALKARHMGTEREGMLENYTSIAFGWTPPPEAPKL